MTYHMIIFYLNENDAYVKHFYAKDDNDLIDIYIDYSKRGYCILYHNIDEVKDA